MLAPPPRRSSSARRGLTGPGSEHTGSGDNKPEAIPCECHTEDLELGTGDTVRLYSWSSDGPECFGDAILVLLCFHGAGDTGLTWLPVAARLVGDQRLHGTVVCAPDLRGHGATSNDGPEAKHEKNIGRLVDDGMQILATVKKRFPGADIVLAGHSLGGSIATRMALQGLELEPPLPVRAAVLLDAVEGTAIDGLPRTAEWLRARKKSFASHEEAISWSLSSGMLQSAAAARTSIPSRLRWDEESKAWVWRADIEGAESLWHAWFEGLSGLFIGLSMPKLLVIGGIDRLDGLLEAANMQGKFRLSVVPHSGHQLHEDRPGEVAEAIGAFLDRVQRQRVAFERLCSSSPSPVLTKKRSRHHREDGSGRANVRSLSRGNTCDSEGSSLPDGDSTTVEENSTERFPKSM